MYKIRTTAKFEKDARKLSSVTIQRIDEKLAYVCEHPELALPVLYIPEDLKGLKKCKVGQWRVFFWIDDFKKELVLYGADNRDAAYRRFKRR